MRQLGSWIALWSVSALGFAQGDPYAGPAAPPQAPPASRETTWPAPTAEDWHRPCLIPFQRTFEDALALAREQHRALLVCVNMDGEIASEHYAGVRYREPAKAALYAPYVCVIASVFRHTPRDYDDEGRRIPCPRFGSVTCGEHIAIEPLVFERFMDGRRIAPRHIAVDVVGGGSELFDILLRFDTASVFDDIQKLAAQQPPPEVALERSLEERVGSRDSRDRAQVERAYLEGDRVTRKRLLEAALVHRELDEIDLLRLAIFGLDVELAQLARAALAESTSEQAIDLIVAALRVPLEAREREALLAALARLGETYPRARSLLVVQQGLARPSSVVDARRLGDGLRGVASPPRPEWGALESGVHEGFRRSRDLPADPDTQLRLAEAALALAVDPTTARILAADYRTSAKYAALQFEDARRAALEAERLGKCDWRVEGVLAITNHYLGDPAEAARRAERALALLPSGEASWNAMAVVSLFAHARQQALLGAARASTSWPAEWLSDLDAAYAVLALHPLGTDAHVAAHFDLLSELQVPERARAVLQRGLERFPESWILHERLRRRALAEGGVAALEEVYAAWLRAEPHPPRLAWFAGYARLVAAEYHRRAGNPEAAERAYGTASAHYEDVRRDDPSCAASADHYQAMALAGRARIAFEHGELLAALEFLEASFARAPSAAAQPDGLNLSAVDTAKVLLARLRLDAQGMLAARLEAALARLDASQLELPAYEQVGPK